MCVAGIARMERTFVRAVNVKRNVVHNIPSCATAEKVILIQSVLLMYYFPLRTFTDLKKKFI